MKRIESIYIKGYRGLKELEVDKFKKYNFFVGDNSSCKTTLLEALYNSLPVTVIGLVSVANGRGSVLTKNEIDNFFYNTETENNIELILNKELKTIIKNRNYFSNEQINNIQRNEEYIKLGNQGISVLYNIEKKLKDEEIISANIITNSSYAIDVNYKTFLPEKINYGGTCFITPMTKHQVGVALIVKELIEKKQKKELLNILNLFEPGIDDIVSDGKNVLLSKENLKKMMSITSFGNGLAAILDIASAILKEDANYVFIDEIETGIHYLNFEKLCKNLIRIAENKNVQLFITTHSDEILKAFYKELGNEEDNISLYRFQKKNDEIKKVYYSKERAKKAFENGWDIR